MPHFLQGLFSTGSGSCHSNPVTCSSDHSLQQFKGVSTTISISGPFGLLPLALLQHGRTHGPQSLQGTADVAWPYTRAQSLWGAPPPAQPYPRTTVSSGVYLLCCNISVATDASAPTGSYPQPQTLQVVLILHGLIHRSNPFNSSWCWSCSLAQQWCPGHGPAPAHCHGCYQNAPRHSWVGW